MARGIRVHIIIFFTSLSVVFTSYPIPSILSYFAYPSIFLQFSRNPCIPHVQYPLHVDSIIFFVHLSSHSPSVISSFPNSISPSFYFLFSYPYFLSCFFFPSNSYNVFTSFFLLHLFCFPQMPAVNGI